MKWRDLLDDELRTKARAHSQLVRRRLCQFLEAMAPELVRDVGSVALALEAQWHGLVIQWAIAGQGRSKPGFGAGSRSICARFGALRLPRAGAVEADVPRVRFRLLRLGSEAGPTNCLGSLRCQRAAVTTRLAASFSASWLAQRAGSGHLEEDPYPRALEKMTG